MNRRSLTVVPAAAAVVLTLAAPAPAAWRNPGKCKPDASMRDRLDPANNDFSTRKVPCYIAAYAIVDMLDRGRWWRSEFRHTSYGARWVVRLSCRTKRLRRKGFPEGLRRVRCRVRSGEDAETRRRQVKNLRGGTIRWDTAYTG
jgi:hypothetical protein